MQLIHLIIKYIVFYSFFISGLFADGKPLLRVLDEHGKPIQGAVVECVLLNQWQDRVKFKTDIHGEIHDRSKFKLNKEYCLLIKSKEYVNYEQLQFNPYSGNTQEVKLKDKGLTFSGNIEGLDLKKLKGTNVFMTKYIKGKGKRHEYPFYEKIPIKENGTFSIHNYSGGPYAFYIEGPAGVSLEKKFFNIFPNKVSKISVSLDTKVEKAVPFKVSFKDDSNKTAAYTNYRIIYSKDKIKKFNNYKALLSMSNQSGEKEFFTLANGYVHISVHDKRYVPNQILNIEVKEKHKVIQLKPYYEFKLKVISEAGEAIPGAVIDIDYRTNKSRRTTIETSGKDGICFFYFKNKDELNSIERVTVWAEGYSEKKLFYEDVKDSKEIILKEGKGFLFKFIERNPNEEDVVLKNMPISFNYGPDYKKIHKETDRDGLIKIKGLKVNDKIHFLVHNKVTEEIRVIEKDSPITVFVSKTYPTYLKLIDSKTQEVINKKEGISLYTIKNHKKVSIVYDSERSAFKLKGLMPRDYKLKLRVKGYQEKIFNFNVLDQVDKIYEIQLKKQRELKFKFVNLEKPYPKKIGFGYKHSNQYWSTREINRVKGKEPIYRYVVNNNDKIKLVSLTVADYLTKELQVHKEKSLYEVELERGYDFPVLVKNLQGEVLKSVKVNISRKNNSERRAAETNEDGEAVLKGLRLGDYRLNLDHKDYAKIQNIDVIVEVEKQPFEVILKKGSAINCLVQVNGEVVEGVEVQLEKQNDWGGFQREYLGGSRKNKTDESGIKMFKNVKNGMYRCSVKKSDKGIGESKTFTIKEDGSTVDVVIELKEGLSLKGVVLDEEDKPVKKLRLNTYTMFGGSHNNVTTDEEGKFEFKNLKEKAYNISLSDQKWVLVERQKQYKTGSEEVVIKVKKTPLLKIKVQSPDEKELSDVKFFKEYKQGRHTQNLHNVEKEKDHWVVPIKEHMWGGYNKNRSVRIKAKAEGYNMGFSEYKTMNEHIESGVFVRLEDEKAFSFLVKNEGYEPIEDISVLAKLSHRTEAEAYTDKEGKALLKGIHFDTYKIEFKKDGYASVQKEYTFDENFSSNTPEVIMTRGGTVSGFVYGSKGDLLNGVQVHLKNLSGDGLNQHLKTNKEGAFKMKHIKAGRYEISYKKSVRNYNEELGLQEIEVFNGEENTIQLHEEKAPNAGEILVKISEELVGGYRAINLISAGGGMNTSKQVTGQEVLFENLTQGTYTLMSYGKSGMVTETVEVQAGQTSEVTFSNEGKIKVIGKVNGVDGSPISSGSISFMKMGGGDLNLLMNPMSMMKNISGSGMIKAGEFEVMIKESGTYQVIIQTFGGGMRMKRIENIQIDQMNEVNIGTISLDAGNVIEVTVTNENGEAVEGARINVMKAGIPQFGHNWVTDSKGYLKLTGVPDLPLNLTVYHGDYVTLNKEVSNASVSLIISSGINLVVELLGENKTKRNLVLMDESGTMIQNRGMHFWGGRSQKSSTHNLGKAKAGRYQIKVLKSNTAPEHTCDFFEVYEGMDKIQINLP